MEKVYKINNRYYLNEDKGLLKLVDASSCIENEISYTMYQFLSCFFIANSLDAGYLIIKNKFTNITRFEYDEIVQDLIEKKILVEYKTFYNLETITKTINVGGMFNADIVDIAEVLKNKYYDIAFLGFPYDISATYKSGSRFAPQFLRNESKSIFEYRVDDEGQARGMWNPVDECYVLQNIRMADCGDLHNIVYDRNGKEFDYLSLCTKRFICNDIFPVIIGGDHSISLATINGASEVYEKIGIFHFDAHDDFGGNTNGKDWKQNCHHGNFISWLVEKTEVEIVSQIGIRQLNLEKFDNKKIKRWSYKNVDDIYSQIEERVPNNIPYYITFDVDCLSPTVISSTGTPLPGGFLYDDIVYLLEMICANYDIIGLDIVELMSGSSYEALIVNKILISILNSVMNKRRVQSDK